MPRAGLTESRVVEEGERMADEVGLERLTLAALALRLGVRQPSLYKHIDGLDGLHRSLAVRAKNELAYVLARAAVGRERGDAITSIARAYRAWALVHRGRYAAAQHPPAPGDADDETASQAVLQVITDALAGYDLHDDDAIHATRALRATLHGFVTLEIAGDFRLAVDIDGSFERLIKGLVAALQWTEDQLASGSRT
jgi:AcrR family transcriptional regulator